ncbi:spermatogenesis associated protein 5 [Physocladia obscura]|uniref:Spermatogenesis associated protein 5 n=1 Tax=Physocladia obscura TaxID=109957 RepID=A0AAD5SRT3_9FUNG|nr:spermatogenesis associated protein 5 [Physocladia obscura]
MDGIMSMAEPSSHLIVIGVTNRKEAIDAAILRPGRMSEFVNITMPNEHNRADIFRGFLDGVPNSVSEKEFEMLGNLSHGCTGADIENFCREAAYVCMRAESADSQVPI